MAMIQGVTDRRAAAAVRSAWIHWYCGEPGV
jgi:hypothetical protein